VDGQFVCHTLEDPPQLTKIAGETRIPGGIYEVALRAWGGFHERYSRDERFKSMHKGMLWIKNTPGFSDILIHCGNTAEHTRGCLLVGMTANNNQVADGKIVGSADAYKRVYGRVCEALFIGEGVELVIGDPVELLRY
jgi:hypothetical protein